MTYLGRCAGLAARAFVLTFLIAAGGCAGAEDEGRPGRLPDAGAPRRRRAAQGRRGDESHRRVDHRRAGAGPRRLGRRLRPGRRRSRPRRPARAAAVDAAADRTGGAAAGSDHRPAGAAVHAARRAGCARGDDRRVARPVRGALAPDHSPDVDRRHAFGGDRRRFLGRAALQRQLRSVPDRRPGRGRLRDRCDVGRRRRPSRPTSTWRAARTAGSGRPRRRWSSVLPPARSIRAKR